MKSYRKNQQGFGTVEALLILVIVVIVAFVGWFVYHTNQKANSTLNSASQTNSNTNATSLTSTKTSTAAGTRAKNIATYLLNYTKGKAPVKSYVDKHVTDGQFTAAFRTSVDNGSALVASGSVNPVTCSQTEPTSFKVSSTSMNGDTAVVTLTSNLSGQAQVPQLTMQYAHNTWSVDQYNCVAHP